jgi:hypothetical protein
MRNLLTVVAATLLFSLNITAQQANTAAVKNVQITPSTREAEVGANR